MVGEKIKQLITVSGKSVENIAEALNMSPQNLYKMLKKDSIDTKHLSKLSKLLNVPIDFFFDDTQTVFGPDLSIRGDKNKTIAGNNNVLNEQVNNTTIATLEEKVKMLEEMLRQANKLIEEKERFIQVLLKK